MGASNGAVAEGLEGIVVAATRMSDVDGERGRLVIRGHDVERLAPTATYEDAFLLLRDGVLPSAAAREALRAAIGEARARAFARLGSLGDALDALDGMEALRAALAHVRSVGDDDADAIALAGMAAVAAAAWSRKRAGREPVAPDASLTQAGDTLRMASGGAAPPDSERAALDAYLVTVSDHGMNASTFTARVVASTAADLVSAIVAAMGALKGPLHGGAPGPVLDMLDAVGTPERATAWLEAELAAGRRIMGMGHRIYRVRDPRAAVLEATIERLEKAGVRTPRLALARAVEHAAERELRARHPDRPLHANVEFYTAVLLDTLGLPRAVFTPTFAIGRLAGWSAHVREQRESKRIIRPASLYVGPPPS
jgi:citrate synthase